MGINKNKEYFVISTSPNSYTEEPTNNYRWRKKLIFGKTLERAWKTTCKDGVYYTWKKVHSVRWGADSLTKYA